RIVSAACGGQRPLLRRVADAWILHYVDHARHSGAIETEMAEKVADLPRSARKFCEGPSLARVGESLSLLDDAVARCRRVVVEISLQSTELVQNVVNVTVDRTDISGFGRLLAGPDHRDLRRRGSSVPCLR